MFDNELEENMDDDKDVLDSLLDAFRRRFTARPDELY